MTETIWKYAIPHQPYTEHSMPLGAEILNVGVQGAEGQIWARVDPDAPQVRRTFALVGTGQDLHFSNGSYVGTFQTPPYVWHVFEVVGGATNDRPD